MSLCFKYNIYIANVFVILYSSNSSEDVIVRYIYIYMVRISYHNNTAVTFVTYFIKNF